MHKITVEIVEVMWRRIKNEVKIGRGAVRIWIAQGEWMGGMHRHKILFSIILLPL